MTPRLEILIDAIQERMESIIGDTSFQLGEILKSVQRYTSEWDGEERISTVLGTLPTIIVREGEETLDWTIENGGVLRTVSVDICCYLANDASGEFRNQVAAEIEYALTRVTTADPVPCWGVNAILTTGRVVNVDPETGIYIDGVHLLVEFKYRTAFGDPSTGV